MKALIITGLLFPLSACLCLCADESIVINEIHYHPDIETQRVEFIELFNAGGDELLESLKTKSRYK